MIKHNFAGIFVVMLVACVLSGALFMDGCAAQKIKTETYVNPTIISFPAGAATPATMIGKIYFVIKGDCLWTIAGKKNIYGDPFQWPLIFKANRDQIRDQDLIYPGQVFKIKTDPSDLEVNEAKTTAYLTPEYKRK